MDISKLLSRPHNMMPGSAAPFLEGFAEELARVGYTQLTVGGYLDSAIHFGGWVEASGLDISKINERIIATFGGHRCKCPGRRRNKSVSQYYTARVERFVDYLRRCGAISSVSTPNTVPIARSSWTSV